MEDINLIETSMEVADNQTLNSIQAHDLTSQIQNMFEVLEERCLTRIEARLSKFDTRRSESIPHQSKSVYDRLTKYHRSQATSSRHRSRSDIRSRDDCDLYPPRESDSVVSESEIRSRPELSKQTPELRSVGRSEVEDRRHRSRSTSRGRYSRFLSKSHEKEPTVKSTDRQETYTSRLVKFRTVDEKLTAQSNFKIWKRKVLGSIDEQDCGFVVDADKPMPSRLSADELSLVTKKVKYFIESCLDDYLYNLMGESDHPREMLALLSRMFEPTTAHHQTSVFDRLNSIRYDPAVEKPVEFISRFNEALKDVTQLNPRLATDEYVRETFLEAIRDSSIYDRVRLSTRDFNLTDLKLMLIDDEIQEQQHGLSVQNRAMSVGAAAPLSRGAQSGSRGRGRGHGGCRWGERGGSNTRSTAVPVAKVNKQIVPKSDKECGFCHRKGHVASSCFRARKTCFNCDQRGHIARDCSKPLSARLKNLSKPSEMRYAQSQDKRKAKKPELIKMQLGQAKVLEKRFENDDDAAFKIFGNKEADDDSEVWVAIGENEQRRKDVASYLQEAGKALRSSEGEWN